MALWVYFTETPRARTVTAETAEEAARAAAQAEGDKHPNTMEGSVTADVWVCPADREVIPARDVQKFEVTYTREWMTRVNATAAPDDPPPAAV